LDLQPDYTNPRSGLAAIYTVQGDYDKARDEIQKMIATSPESFSDYGSAGGLEILRGNYTEAAKYYEKALDFLPNGLIS